MLGLFLVFLKPFFGIFWHTGIFRVQSTCTGRHTAGVIQGPVYCTGMHTGVIQGPIYLYRDAFRGYSGPIYLYGETYRGYSGSSLPVHDAYRGYSGSNLSVQGYIQGLFRVQSTRTGMHTGVIQGPVYLYRDAYRVIQGPVYL